MKDTLQEIDSLWKFRFCSDGSFQDGIRRIRGGQDGPPKRVVAVDFDNVFNRGVCKTIDDFRRLHRELSPGVFLVAVDSPYNRKSMKYPELYKGEPREKREGFWEDRKEILEKLKGFTVEVAGYESDDIMATASFRAQVLGWECILVTNDRDMWGCLGTKTVMYDGYSYTNAAKVLAKHKIRAGQSVDYFCLVGKNGLKGVPLIGPETASNLLEAHQTVIGMYERRDTTKKMWANLERFVEGGDYLIHKEIHTLSRTVPFYWGEER